MSRALLDTNVDTKVSKFLISATATRLMRPPFHENGDFHRFLPYTVPPWVGLSQNASNTVPSAPKQICVLIGRAAISRMVCDTNRKLRLDLNFDEYELEFIRIDYIVPTKFSAV